MELFSYLLKLNNYFLYKVAFWTPVLKHIWCLQTITVSTLVDIWISASLDTRSLFKLALSPSALTLVVSDSSVHGSCLQWQGVSQLSATLLTQAARIRHHSKNACVCLLLLGRKSHLLRTIWAPGTLTTVGLVIILIFSVVRTRIHTHIFSRENISWIYNNSFNSISECQDFDLPLSIIHLYLTSPPWEAGFRHH